MPSLDAIRAAFPAEGLFAEKEWLLSPEPFPLEPAIVRQLEGLGHRLRLFIKACNELYHRSLKGKLPPWIAAYADPGKPASLLELARAKAIRDAVPRVLRPDLLLGENGLTMTELDSVPGGIGLTAWLNRAYAEADPLGGADGMIEGFRSIFPEDQPVDIAVSREAGSYRPEMEWLAGQLGADRFSVHDAEAYSGHAGRAVYRFFELFDLPNLPASTTLLERVAAGELSMTAPPKPWLEEKLWLALFHSRPLQEIWRRELSDNQQKKLRELIPWSWIVDPTPLPHHGVLPRLDVAGWDDVARFHQKERQLVLKRSGFHEEAWGARSVTIGHDVSQTDWTAALAEATAAFPEHPFVLQEFHRAKVVEHPFFDPQTGVLRTLRARARLCPYYFVSATDESIRLGGVLATLCPEDKKILHGMKDAILVPCCGAAE